MGISVDPVETITLGEGHRGDPGRAANYPMIGDPELKVAKLYDMLPAEVGRQPRPHPSQQRHGAQRCSSSGPDKKIKLMLVYPMSPAATSTRFCV